MSSIKLELDGQLLQEGMKGLDVNTPPFRLLHTVCCTRSDMEVAAEEEDLRDRMAAVAR